jgi:hypothetical protein
VSGPWDKQLQQMGADCFLFAPDGPTPKQKAQLLEMLKHVRQGLHQPIRLKLTDHMSSDLVGYVNAEPIAKKPNGRQMINRLNGLRISKGDVHCSRKFFSESPTMKATLLHELSHVFANTTDIGSMGKDDEGATRNYNDYPYLARTGRFRYSEGRTPESHLAPLNADGFTYFTLAAAGKLPPPEPALPKPTPAPAKPTTTKPVNTATSTTEASGPPKAS